MGERRRGNRFNLSLPVELKDGTGTTRDISSSGIFFETDKVLSVGEIIDLCVVFHDSTIQCKGLIVRVENFDDNLGIAVEFTSYGFQ